ncbi:MAG TPA: Ku protein [Gemmatimonadaceae bacterium]|nr:Ku protein [Gemmatimonadaceae bacterium]
MWKGRITFGSIELPVKLYAAVEDKSIHFRLLDAKNNEPVVQHMIDPKTGDVVPSEEVRSAYATKAGQLVLLDEDELDATEPRDSREVEILRFVDSDAIASEWYDRPYWLGPDGQTSRLYFALARALADQNKEGVARWVMRKKEYVGALKAEGGHLALITLRRTGEVVPASSLSPPRGRDLNQKEVAMARQLVESMQGSFDIESYHDTYRERVQELADAKAEGKVVKFPRTPRRESQKSLASVLQKSLAAARQGKAAGRKSA